MKTFSLSLLAFFMTGYSNWGTDFNKARETAGQQHKYILLNFSGSDWCGPCIMMKKDIFDTDAFSKMADSSLILVNADFPRQRKNQLSKELQQQNNILADKYDREGVFPCTVLISPDGKIARTWQGYPGGNAEKFISQVQTAMNGPQ